MKKFAISSILLIFTFLSSAYSETLISSEPSLSPFKQFLVQSNFSESSWPELTPIKQDDLAKPYDKLLTNTLMTAGLAEHYNRTPKVRPPLYIIDDTKEKTYSRAILMIVDKDQSRDEALAADQLGEAKVVELGLITMNFATLPANVIDGVKNTKIPFGALLEKYDVKVTNGKRHYISLTCNADLVKTMECKQGETLYGRTNVLINSNGEWIARVNEILSSAN